MKSIRRSQPACLIACLLSVGSNAWAQAANACDLDKNGVVDQRDVVLAVNMALGVAPCTATVQGPGVCTVVLVQRVANAASGTCLTDGPTAHTVSLSWVLSTSPDVVGYNVYRATGASGQYVKINSSLVLGTGFSDMAVVSGQTYSYVATAVDSRNVESDYSNVTQAAIPVP